MPAVCSKRLHGGGDGDRSPRASQARAGSVLGRLELAAYLPPMPRGEDGYGEPPPRDAGAGRVAGASKGDPIVYLFGAGWQVERDPEALVLSRRHYSARAYRDGRRMAKGWKRSPGRGGPWRGATSKRQSGAPGASPPSGMTDVTKAALTPARRRLVELMQEVNYGRIRTARSPG